MDHTAALLRWLERRVGFLAIKHLTLLLLAGQVLVLVLSYAHPQTGEAPATGVVQPQLFDGLTLQLDLVRAGQFWRLASFLFLPISDNPLWAFFGLIFLYFQGRTLEETWGAFRFTVFIGVGWLATIAAACLTPHVATTNVYLLTTILLAFACVAPEFEFLLFFVLPVKMKHFAIAVWILLALHLVGDVLQHHWAAVAAQLAALSNYVLFFGEQHWRDWHGVQRAAAFAAKATPPAAKKLAWHTCAVCGVTDQSAPHEDFRVCSLCTGGKEYCAAHRQQHAHT